MPEQNTAVQTLGLMAAVNGERRQLSKSMSTVASLVTICSSKCSRVPAVEFAEPTTASFWGDAAADDDIGVGAVANGHPVGRAMTARDAHRRVEASGSADVAVTGTEAQCMRACVARFMDVKEYLMARARSK
jgi:hypothetical protein